MNKTFILLNGMLLSFHLVVKADSKRLIKEVKQTKQMDSNGF